MSVVFATKPSHPALLPPTPPTSRPNSPPQTTLALPLHGKFGLQTGAATGKMLKSPLAKSPITKSQVTTTVTVVPAPAHNATGATATTTIKSLAPLANANTNAPVNRAPLPCYSMLRAFHATTIRYVISKLRWDQTHSGYIPGCDPWDKINIVIGKLEEELCGVESAQKLLDKYPNLSHPIAPHGQALVKSQTYGPLTSQQFDAEIGKERLKELALDKQLFEQFPFLKQAFVGPRTKSQAKAHGDMRKIIFDGEFYMDDLEEMMPEENLKAAMEGLSIDPYRKKPSPSPPPPPQPGARRMRKMTYDEIRLEKEQVKINAQFKAAGLEPPQPPKKIIPKPEGPMTKEEWMSTLPVYGPETKGEAMLPVQRQQRQIILTWLKHPWPVYDEEAAGLMHKMGTLAYGRLEEKAKENKGGGGGKKVGKDKSKEGKVGSGTKDRQDASGEKRDMEIKKETMEEEKMIEGVKAKSSDKEEEKETEGDRGTMLDPELKPTGEEKGEAAGAAGDRAEVGSRIMTGELKLEIQVVEDVEMVHLAEKVKAGLD